MIVSKWQTIVFDLDDTLYPERQYVLSGFRAVAAWAAGALGLPEGRSYDELHELFVTGVRGDTFNQWLAAHDVEPQKYIPAMVAAYREHRPQIAFHDGAAEMLRQLAVAHRLGVVTDGPLDVQRRKAAALGLESLVDAVVYSDELGRDAWKPSPRPFAEVLRRLDAAAEASVYVADNPAKDFLGARRAGMASIRIRHADGLHVEEEPESAEYAPDLEIASFDELPTWVAGNG